MVQNLGMILRGVLGGGGGEEDNLSPQQTSKPLKNTPSRILYNRRLATNLYLWSDLLSKSTVGAVRGLSEACGGIWEIRGRR